MTLERPLRVALFSGNYNYLREGANQALNKLVAHLESIGHQVRVYSPVTETPAFPPQGTLIPVPSITLPFRTEFRLALGLPAAIRRDVESFAPDLVHVSTPDILCARAVTLAKRLDVPVVASLHTRFETYFEHYGAGWLKPLAETHLGRFYRRADRVLAPNAALVEEMKRLRGDDRVSLWSRGVDRELFNPARRDLEWRRSHGWADDEPVVLFFGRLVLEKGLDTYVEVIRSLARGGNPVHPLIVGAGPAGDRLRSLRGAAFTGHLDGAELARAVAGADIMVHPSTTEAFGNVVLEGMAAGLAVVAANAPSARTLIDHGRTGILFAPGDANDCAQAVARLIRSPEERRRIATAARAASEGFSWDSASRQVEDAYCATLALRSRYARATLARRRRPSRA